VTKKKRFHIGPYADAKKLSNAGSEKVRAFLDEYRKTVLPTVAALEAKHGMRLDFDEAPGSFCVSVPSDTPFYDDEPYINYDLAEALGEWP
jgi:hypothetical protein